ncbi:hypothetical protein OC707_01895 ['Opuntia sp.' phytoplasma]|uniref:Uncharacterized protein n=1 Tax=Candidatus Phytoplasma asiaticum TaxID=2763338 RepID=A0AAX3B9K7_9MOLU|nr:MULTISPECIES: hypothetical protein [Phytoplasma]MDO8054197.1 hypothetical protein ['Opuntia sp.' phytoplasma]MDO8058027.1 hypothetical protein ['Opuntia sp.' phytoplasma]UQV27073.1 hypothetical protein H7686_0001770 ['Parthenium hysterophorus' phyllody phytoplasma]
MNTIVAQISDDNNQKIIDLKTKIFQYRIILDTELNQTQKFNKEFDILSSNEKEKLQIFLNDIETQRKTYITELNNFQINNPQNNKEVILLNILEKQEKSYIELGRKRCS